MSCYSCDLAHTTFTFHNNQSYNQQIHSTLHFFLLNMPFHLETCHKMKVSHYLNFIRSLFSECRTEFHVVQNFLLCFTVEELIPEDLYWSQLCGGPVFFQNKGNLDITTSKTELFCNLIKTEIVKTLKETFILYLRLIITVITVIVRSCMKLVVKLFLT